MKIKACFSYQRQASDFYSNVVLSCDQLPWRSHTGFTLFLFYFIYSNASVLLVKNRSTIPPNNYEICQAKARTINVSSL